jgi:rhamnulokinase
MSGTLRWDVRRIFDELKVGLRKVAMRGHRIESISADSWGLDYVLLKDRQLLTAPYHYRDSRTDGAVERACQLVPADLIYSETGSQFMQVNSLYQLLDDLEHHPQVLEICDQFLGVGDYFNYLMSGVCCGEESFASTTQLFNPAQLKWSHLLIEKFHLPPRIFPKLVPSGKTLGPLLPSIALEVGLADSQVVASCSHDTGAAVAAVPEEGQDWCYNSSGTWSLFGIENAKPIINAKAREYNFTNEVGFAGTIRFLKNVSGLWIVQECHREWAREGRDYAYDQLTEMAVEAEPLKSLINPFDPIFLKPNEMPERIADYCRRTNQMPPKTPGETIRCTLESLALAYCVTMRQIANATDSRPKCLHIVGGGSKNRLLNQLSANACQVTVFAGPSEATAVGNILIQAIALGHLGSLTDLRRVVGRSFPVEAYQPTDASIWQKAYERFQKLILK